ncbi:MAG: aminoglycoside phosphotransferase family protein [Oscillospiraceae bacterium]|nr:aminoglycoside phosphotransferase family protein [Oscillospiraceae bacterium]
MNGVKITQLHGGTVGDVKLIECEKAVLKTQKKWGRSFDFDSWRREYDLYKSGFCELFDDSLRWAECYHAEMNENGDEYQLWLEHIGGVTGADLTAEMLEQAAYELGRFQGRLYAEKPRVLQSIANFSNTGFLKQNYLHYRGWSELYDYIRSDDCGIPEHLCRMLIEIDESSEEIFRHIEKLPVVLCHRDFWNTNIFYTDSGIRLIDWDTAGWGYFGEDIAALIADEADIQSMTGYYRKCAPAYYKGFSEYAAADIKDNCVYELMLIIFGYRFVEWYKFGETPEEKKLQINALQKIYEMREIKL